MIPDWQHLYDDASEGIEICPQTTLEAKPWQIDSHNCGMKWAWSAWA